jgi:hypothetical protein
MRIAAANLETATLQESADTDIVPATSCGTDEMSLM